MEAEGFSRRAGDARGSDKTDEEILQLIRDAKADSEKAHLIVLYQINRNVTRQVEVLDHVVERLRVQEEQTTAHRMLIAKGSGAWRAAALTLGTVGILGSVILVGYFNDLKSLIISQAAQDVRLMRLETNTPISREADTRIKILEAQMTQNVGMLIDLTHRQDDHERADSRAIGLVRRK